MKTLKIRFHGVPDRELDLTFLDEKDELICVLSGRKGGDDWEDESGSITVEQFFHMMLKASEKFQLQYVADIQLTKHLEAAEKEREQLRAWWVSAKHDLDIAREEIASLKKTIKIVSGNKEE